MTQLDESWRESTESLLADALRKNVLPKFRTTATKTWFTEYIGRELDFVTEVLGLRTRDGHAKLWYAEREILRALFEHKFVVVRSCRGSGKTFTEGVLIPTFLYTAPSRVVATAPTDRHLREVMWTEVSRVWRGSRLKLPGELFTKALRIDDRYSAIGIPCKTADHVRGFHAGIVVPDDPDEYEGDSDSTAKTIEEQLRAASGEGMRLLIVIDEAS